MNLDVGEYQLRKPHWRLRNKLIADKLLEPNKSVLDLGGGARNLLWYYKPSKYCNVDGMDMREVDKVLDLDGDWYDHVEGGWDYCVNSGILEYLKNVPLFLEQQKPFAKEHIFSWWPGNPIFGRQKQPWFVSILEQNYEILDSEVWGEQCVYKCRPK